MSYLPSQTSADGGCELHMPPHYQLFPLSICNKEINNCAAQPTIGWHHHQSVQLHVKSNIPTSCASLLDYQLCQRCNRNFAKFHNARTSACSAFTLVSKNFENLPCLSAHLSYCANRFLNVKALVIVGTFNKK